MPESPLIAPGDLGTIDRILDCRAGPDRGGYDREHLAGSLRAELESDLSAPGDPAVGGRHPLPALGTWCATLGRWGIGPDTSIAVVDGAGGGLYAARAWWMLRAVGHRHVTVVDGGYRAAVEAGFPTDARIPEPEPLPPYPCAAWAWPIADADAVEAHRTDPGWRVVDARSAARWRGEVEPIDPVAGRIAGSVNLPYESLIADGHFAPIEEVRRQLAAVLGETPPERVIASCGSGVTACHTLLAMAVVGLEPGALYVGSWGEWSRQGRPSLPR